MEKVIAQITINTIVATGEIRCEAVRAARLIEAPQKKQDRRSLTLACLHDVERFSRCFRSLGGSQSSFVWRRLVFIVRDWQYVAVGIDCVFEQDLHRDVFDR